MKLTRYTDYSIRVLMHLATHEQEPCSIASIAGAYGISRSHLMKVVRDLGRTGYVETLRGRNGGIRLRRPAGDINLGGLVRGTESGFQLVDCPNCPIAPACGLTGVLAEAVRAFLAVLDRYSLADLVTRRGQLRRLLALAG